ncbi:MAG: carbohydrate ABC transporter permease [Chloroflexota bacterium]
MLGRERPRGIGRLPGVLTRLRLYGLSRRQLAWAFFLPSVLMLLAVLGYPTYRLIWTSLHTIRLDQPWIGEPYVGLKNYDFVLHDSGFWNSVGLSAYFTVGAVVCELLLGLSIALVVNQSFRGRGLMRAAMLVPWAIPAILSAKLWSWMYSPEVGAFNGLLNIMHITSGAVDPLGNPTWVMPAVILADVWKNTPFVGLILLAGLQVVPAELYEAARVDGAGVMQRFMQITLPLLKGSIVVALLFRTITAFQTYDLVVGLTNGGPGTDTEILSLHAYRVLFSFVNFGEGSTMAALLAVICIVVAAVYASQLNIEEV